MENGIIKALVGLMKDVGAIGKDKTASTGGGGSFKFRGIDDVYNATQSGLIKRGIICAPEFSSPVREERKTKAGGAIIFTTISGKFTFYCVEDSSSITVKTIGEAADTGDKSTNKAMSAAYKYAMFQLLCIPTEASGIDSEIDTYEVATKEIEYITEKQQSEILDRLNATDSDVVKFLRWLANNQKIRVTSVADIPKSSFEVAIDKIQEKEEDQKKKAAA